MVPSTVVLAISLGLVLIAESNEVLGAWCFISSFLVCSESLHLVSLSETAFPESKNLLFNSTVRTMNFRYKAIARLSCAFCAITTPYINVDQCSSRPGRSLFSGTGHGMIINYVGIPITAEFSDLFCPTSTSTVSSKSAQTKSKKIVSNWHAIIVSLANSMSSLQSWMKTCRKYLIILGCSHKLCKFCVNGRSAIAFFISFTIHYVYMIRSNMLVIIVFS